MVAGRSTQGDAWRVWNRDASVEQRTFQRATGELPEMECTKQLVRLVAPLYSPGMAILDVGCAAGHYYNGLQRIDPGIRYHGIDATAAYIDFARRHFKDHARATFEVGDIFALPATLDARFDIVFCCNLLLHLPSVQVPLANLLRVSRKHCIVRTLIADRTHLSRLLYTDSFDENGEPTDFVYQNTYSHDFIRRIVGDIAPCEIEFIDDEFDAAAINDEHRRYGGLQSAVTRAQSGLQIAGSKVFDWKWVRITKS